MNFTTEQLLLVAGIVLIIYALVGALGISIRQVKLPALPPLTRVALCFFGVVLIFLGIANQILHTERTFESPTIDSKRLDICLFRGGNACGYEAATIWCRTQGYKLASIWTVDSAVGHTEVLSNRSDCGSDDCSAFRTITCMR
jgi:hypothetical protein